MREINIKFIVDNEEINVKSSGNCKLTEVMQENNILFSNICNGNGTCGKCKIKVLSGNIPIKEADRRFFSEQELRQGIRLGCKVDVADHVEELCIEVLRKMEEDIVVEGVQKKSNSSNSCGTMQSEAKHDNKDRVNNTKYFIAIDIGTTTIAMALIHEENGEICDIFTTLNHQREYGADVLSRITAANNGKAELLKNSIENDLWKGICRLIHKEDKTRLQVPDERIQSNDDRSGINISKIVISANTTMIHLLMGYSCVSLGKYPFHSSHLGQIECTLKECIRAERMKEESMSRYEDVPVTILPGIAAFVGGDIAAGVLSCLGFETEEIYLLVDLGTNGEIVLGNKDRILVTSTAAGPAFEGGNITCGVASIPGGICQMKLQNRRPIIKTIQNKLPPLGICGSGLVSIIAQLIQDGIIDEEGVLKKPYCDQGFSLWTFENGEKIALYQKDIREFQLAKSAIRAGIEILMDEYGCNTKEITHIYLAGGLGVNLTEEDAIMTGILPKEFKGKIEYIGNGSLKGAIQYGMEWMNKSIIQDAKEDMISERANKMQHIVQKSKYISLAESSKFQEMYLKYIGFQRNRLSLNAAIEAAFIE